MSTVFSSSLFFPFALPPSLYATSDTHQEEEQQELQTTTAIEIDAKNSPPVPSSKSDRASWGLKRYLPYCWRNHGSPPSHPLPSYSVLDQTVSCCYGDDKKGEMLIVPTPRENFPPLTPGKESCLTHRGKREHRWILL
ncbi:hypothetical protein CSUI_007328 [Cystoisospora suis]|uniref:Transmembrane protein n=1 Tax=Cystoisospora suis TaxID=483139 RepID=A0A2C6KR06_9APIC|nr:hypothetical protein CSUI_007328 [Cystoisospora suis]